MRCADDTILLLITASGLEEMILSVKNHSQVQNLYLIFNKTNNNENRQDKKEQRQKLNKRRRD